MKNLLIQITSIFKKIISLLTKQNKIESIYNYHKISNLFETSGQPTKKELRLLALSRYDVIINLAPSSYIEGIAVNESKILNNYNITYIHLPVDFKNPTISVFDKFTSYIKQYESKKIWVHCAANMRVSSFVYKYRRDVLNMPHEEIIDDLRAIWIPNKTWFAFLELEKYSL